jgi:nucleoside-diphosphate-sugar epimerase
MNDAGRALVTGATGFAGSHLVRRLVRDGWEVHVLTRTGSPQASPPFEEVRDRLAVHALADPASGAQDVVASVQPRIVFHLASAGGYDHHADDIENLVAVNIRFGTELLEGLRTMGGGLLVWTGTSWQHYEGNDYRPVSLYAATKQAFADILTFYNEAAAVRSVSLILSDTYGPDDRRHKLFAQLEEAITTGVEVKLSPGEQLVDYLYVDDLIEALVTAARLLFEGGEGGTFSVSSGEVLSVRDLVVQYAKTRGCPVPVSLGGRQHREREMMEPWTGGDPLPGWRPRVRLADGLARSLGHRWKILDDQSPFP